MTKCKPPLYALLPIVSETFGISIEALKGPDRDHSIVLARWAYWLLVREFFPTLRSNKIAKLLDKHRTSAIGAFEKAGRYIEFNPDYRDRIETARQRFSYWHQGASHTPRNSIQAATLAAEPKSPSATVSVAPFTIKKKPGPKPVFDPIRMHDEEIRQSLLNSELRFLSRMREEYPDRVRVEMQDAAE